MPEYSGFETLVDTLNDNNTMHGGGHICIWWMKMEYLIVIFAAELHMHSPQGILINITVLSFSVSLLSSGSSLSLHGTYTSLMEYHILKMRNICYLI